jgi:HPt (histidine-containing phosphotransfer) domain-containing protein
MMNDDQTKPFATADLAEARARRVEHSPRPEQVAGRQPGPPPATGGPASPVPGAIRESPAVAADASAVLLDHSTIDGLRRLGGDLGKDLLGALVSLYLESSEPLRDQLREAVRARDALAMRQSAHGLKSSSANVGAIGISDVASKLEALGREGRFDGAPALLGELERRYPLACEQLRLACDATGA